LWLEKPNVKFCTEASKRLTGGEAFTREDALFSRSACRYNDNMRRRTIDFASRILLLVALATFLSPGFGWEMVASHEQLEHAAVSSSDLHEHDSHDHDSHEHANPHSSIGHLLSHMPAALSEPTTTPVTFSGKSNLPEPRVIVPYSIFEPPFRPPYSLLLV
jgi:hypothetical protein